MRLYLLKIKRLSRLVVTPIACLTVLAASSFPEPSNAISQKSPVGASEREEIYRRLTELLAATFDGGEKTVGSFKHSWSTHAGGLHSYEDNRAIADAALDTELNHASKFVDRLRRSYFTLEKNTVKEIIRWALQEETSKLYWADKTKQKVSIFVNDLRKVDTLPPDVKTALIARHHVTGIQLNDGEFSYSYGVGFAVSWQPRYGATDREGNTLIEGQVKLSTVFPCGFTIGREAYIHLTGRTGAPKTAHSHSPTRAAQTVNASRVLPAQPGNDNLPPLSPATTRSRVPSPLETDTSVSKNTLSKYCEYKEWTVVGGRGRRYHPPHLDQVHTTPMPPADTNPMHEDLGCIQTPTHSVSALPKEIGKSEGRTKKHRLNLRSNQPRNPTRYERELESCCPWSFCQIL